MTACPSRPSTRCRVRLRRRDAPATPFRRRRAPMLTADYIGCAEYSRNFIVGFSRPPTRRRTHCDCRPPGNACRGPRLTRAAPGSETARRPSPVSHWRSSKASCEGVERLAIIGHLLSVLRLASFACNCSAVPSAFQALPMLETARRGRSLFDFAKTLRVERRSAFVRSGRIW